MQITNEDSLRALICRVGALMHQRGFIDATSGNISARLDENRVLATPSGLAKGFMTPEQLIVVDMDGRRVDTPNAANADLRPTSELAMHLECYRKRPDVSGVVHAHPQTAVALTIADYDFNQCLIPEVVVTMGYVPITPYATPASIENRDAITVLIENHDVILLAHHGSLTVGKTVWEAYLLLESLEHNANILYRVAQLGGARSHIPPDKLRLLMDARRKLGLMRPGDEAWFEAFIARAESERV